MLASILLERKLKAVIDTNLFISGLFAKDSLSAQLQDLWINQKFELVTSLEIIKEVIQSVRDRIGPVAAFKTATVVKRLPKTRSGKILRGTIQSIADNKDYKVPATIDDPTILGEMEDALEGIGYAGARKD